ncbi:unnamed protein product [Gadus morhua 'NCC']
MQDFQGRPKHYGGDSWWHGCTPGAGGRSGGHGGGHLTAPTSALFPAVEGPAQVTITMVHSSEAVAVLQRLREQRPTASSSGVCSLGKLSETSVCNMCPAAQSAAGALCNYTTPHRRAAEALTRQRAGPHCRAPTTVWAAQPLAHFTPSPWKVGNFRNRLGPGMA